MKTKGLITMVIFVGILSMSASVFANSTEENVGTSSVTSITLAQDGNSHVAWILNGESPLGFKVVWSKTSSPTYPTRDSDQYIYLGDPAVRSSEITAFNGDGTYYVRVCEYLGGKCGVYSNEIQMNLGGETEKFSDVDEKNENYDAIYYLKEKEVVVGYEDTSFKPGENINRAEFLKIVMEVSKYEPTGSNCYVDVKEQWYAGYICKATELEIVNGYEGNYFRPENDINFAEASKIIVKTLAVETVEESLETWYQKYVIAMEMLSAIPSSIDGFDKKVTRGEMAEMVYRIDANNTSKTSRSYDELKPSVPLKMTVKDAGEKKVSWTVEGYSKNGFKVVWSKNAGPTYPTRENDQYMYYSDPDRRNSDELSAFKGEGVYHVRVCEYLGGKCGIYSNGIELSL